MTKSLKKYENLFKNNLACIGLSTSGRAIYSRFYFSMHLPNMLFQIRSLEPTQNLHVNFLQTKKNICVEVKKERKKKHLALLFPVMPPCQFQI